MDTQTSQAFVNENKNNQEEQKDQKWAKAAKVAGAAAAVAGVGGLAASVLGEDQTPAEVADDNLTAQAEVAEQQEMQEQVETVEASVSNDAPAHAPMAEKAASHPEANPAASPAEQPATASPADVAQASAQEATSGVETAHVEASASTHVDAAGFVADENGVPVDAQWLDNDLAANENAPVHENNDVPATAELNQELPPMSQSAMNILNSAVNDELADKVNVSPEIFMSMMGLKPTDMIQTELNGDGQMHMAALLANDNGQYLLLVDSDGDGFLDTITDMTGHEYAMLSGGITFEVNVADMQAFVHEINPETAIDSPMYASSGAHITAIEGDGEGDDVAYVDENDIIDTPTEVNADDTLETASADDFVIDDLAKNDDAASGDDDDAIIDLIGYDDSSMA